MIKSASAHIEATAHGLVSLSQVQRIFLDQHAVELQRSPERFQCRLLTRVTGIKRGLRDGHASSRG